MSKLQLLTGLIFSLLLPSFAMAIDGEEIPPMDCKVAGQTYVDSLFEKVSNKPKGLTAMRAKIGNRQSTYVEVISNMNAATLIRQEEIDRLQARINVIRDEMTKSRDVFVLTCGDEIRWSETSFERRVARPRYQEEGQSKPQPAPSQRSTN